MSMHKGLIGKSDGGGSADLTLGDYIARKQRAAAFDEVAKEKKLTMKLTFEEWLKTFADNNGCAPTLYEVWEAAQENK